MRRLFLILLFAAVAAEATAQSLESFKRRLTEPRSGCRIEVHEAPAAAAAFSAASAEAASKSFNGWRINLFFSNGQHARDEAREVVTQFEESFPGLSVDMFYDNPYFKVSAGRCATAEEATLTQKMMRASAKNIVLADSSKFGRRGFGRICSLEQIDCIVTDDGISELYRKLIEEAGVDLIVVKR